MALRRLLKNGTVHINYDHEVNRGDGELTSGLHCGPVTFVFKRFGEPVFLSYHERLFINDEFQKRASGFPGTPITRQTEDQLLALMRSVLRDLQQHTSVEFEEKAAYEDPDDSSSAN